jgi:hypothetical protein
MISGEPSAQTFGCPKFFPNWPGIRILGSSRLLSPASRTAIEIDGSSERRPASVKPAVFDIKISITGIKISSRTNPSSCDHIVKGLIRDVVDSSCHEFRRIGRKFRKLAQ